MSNTQFAKLTTNKRNLTPGQKGKNFVSTPYDLVQPYKEVELGSSGVTTTSTSSIELVTGGFDIPLYEGTLLRIKDDWSISSESELLVVVSAYTAAAATSIPIETIVPASAKTATAKVRIYAWIPFFSTEQFSNDDTAEVIKGNVFSDGLRPEKAVVTIDGTASSSGGWVYDDPGFKEVRKAYKAASAIYYEHLFAYLRGGIGFEAYVTQNGRSANRNEFVQANNQYEVVGDTIDIPAIA